ncbi:RagB/SusD family nutrient uptake outer membrane protein [Pedobacter frigoris]|uniref:RagB/SusD family nutrient uptake outer membrane protein n=1 Tax=Pedobacter frigoris TaxID=2571272 RepID=UPI0029306222|nr:RagB/SusD family nutrient uptake outer membrane protein [Pedobacter frigoris]
MKKRYIVITTRYTAICFIVTICLFIVSCGKDFLNVPVASTIIKQDYVKDLQTNQEFLNGIYYTLSTQLGSPSALYADIVADNINPSAGFSVEQVQYLTHYNWQQNADDKTSSFSNMNHLSYSLYGVIASLNFSIESSIKFRSENAEKADLIRGQALTLRALSYSYLLNFFAQPYSYTADASHLGVAIQISDDWRVLPKQRSTVKEVYDYIIKDLNAAILLMPPIKGSTLFVNKYAAAGLLSRVLLAKGDYSNARKYARMVAEVMPLMTVNYPSKLFTLQETEAIFQIPQNERSPILFASFYLRTNVLYRPSADMVSLLNESATDLRASWVTKVGNDWTVTKFPQSANSKITIPSVSYYPTILRSSEMYLIAAESYAQLNNTDSARFYLDAIRKRADATAIGTTASGNVLLEAIYKERRKELAFEGHRMFDLLRWKKGVIRTNPLNVQYTELPYPSNMAIAPIPLKDVQLAGMEQNPGY